MTKHQLHFIKNTCIETRDIVPSGLPKLNAVDFYITIESDSERVKYFIFIPTTTTPIMSPSWVNQSVRINYYN